MLEMFQRSPLGVEISDELDRRLWRLLAQTEREIQRAGRTTITLQKARHAVGVDRLIESERHARRVLNSNDADAQQVEQARAILEQIRARRAQAGAHIGAVLEGAVEDFENGQYARAKTTLKRIGDLGLDLDPAHQRELAVYRERIATLERTRGESFGVAPVAMGVLAVTTTARAIGCSATLGT